MAAMAREGLEAVAAEETGREDLDMAAEEEKARGGLGVVGVEVKVVAASTLHSAPTLLSPLAPKDRGCAMVRALC